LPVETNIVIFELNENNAPAYVADWKEKGIYGYAIAPNRVRLVVHLDISESMIEKTIELINTIP